MLNVKEALPHEAVLFLCKTALLKGSNIPLRAAPYLSNTPLPSRLISVAISSFMSKGLESKLQLRAKQ